MNISVLDKLEKGSILLDWSKYLNRVHLNPQNLSELVDYKYWLGKYRGNI
jgi:hypothetical protein